MRSNSGIAGWIKNSFIDFPGTVSTVLFFSGCNLSCPYCHNPAIVQGRSGQSVLLQEVLDFLSKRKGMIEGVVLSGGEPTIHETIVKTAIEIRSLGYKIKLDTNGMLPKKIQEIKPDYLALDVKTTPENYSAVLKATYTNVRERLVESISIVKAMKENAEIRITLAPKIVNDKVIEDIGAMIAGVKKAYLQPLQTKVEILDPAFNELERISEKEVQIYRGSLQKFVEKCEIRS
jgi:pyruvate formate lyase activating enzyme